jgi:predicted Zn-dependent protease
LKKNKLFQLILIFGVLLIIIFLYLQPKTVLKSETVDIQNNQQEDNNQFYSFLISEAAKYGEEALNFNNSLFEKTKSSKNNDSIKSNYNNLIQFWEMNNFAPLVSYYEEQLLFFLDGKIDSLYFADEYFSASKGASEELKQKLFLRASEYYNSVDELEANLSTDQLMNYAICLVETGTNPMQGIGILNNISQREPENYKVQLNLGYFSVKSGQFDKAEQRFLNVLEIEPKFVEAYLYLGDVAETVKDYDKAIKYYTLYKNSLSNEKIALEVEKYIDQLRSKSK